LRKLEEDRDQLQRLRKDPIEFGIFALSHTFYFLTLALLGWLVAGIQPEGPPLAAYAFGLAVISMAIGFVIGDTFGELHRLRHFERTINRIDMKIESHRRIIGDAAQYLER
jgi:hypothetical protein